MLVSQRTNFNKLTNTREIQNSRVEVKDDQMVFDFASKVSTPCPKKSMHAANHHSAVKSSKKRRYQDFLANQNELNEMHQMTHYQQSSYDESVIYSSTDNSQSPSSSCENQNKINIPCFKSYAKYGGMGCEAVSDAMGHMNGSPNYCYREPPLKRCKNSETYSWLQTHLQHYIQSSPILSSPSAASSDVSNDDYYYQVPTNSYPCEQCVCGGGLGAPQRPQQQPSTESAVSGSSSYFSDGIGHQNLNATNQQHHSQWTIVIEEESQYESDQEEDEEDDMRDVPRPHEITTEVRQPNNHISSQAETEMQEQNDDSEQQMNSNCDDQYQSGAWSNNSKPASNLFGNNQTNCGEQFGTANPFNKLNLSLQEPETPNFGQQQDLNSFEFPNMSYSPPHYGSSLSLSLSSANTNPNQNAIWIR